MNLRTLMCALGAFGLLAFSTACEITTDTGTGGSGGEGGAGVGGAGGMGGEGTGGMGGSGGAGGMGACYEKKCAEYITDNPPEDFCADNPSKAIYDALALCTCGDPVNPATGGKCKDACKDEACAGMDVMAGGACQMCIADTNMGCGNEFNACSNDF
ncbi:MAG: hypothetical protein HUU21_22805 [Polyangiaceae bacterium]|nr:hypothetical protein [Polyangiaceae bacterium]